MSPFGWAVYCILVHGIIHFNPGCRMLGLSVESADGANLSTIRYLWRLVLKYLWVLLGILVLLPLTMRPLSVGLAILTTTTGPPIFFAAFVLWWMGGAGRSVYDQATGTAMVDIHPPQWATLLVTWLILTPPVALLFMLLSFLGGGIYWAGPWDVPEYEVDSWLESRNMRYAENLTNYSLAVLGLTALTYAIFGWRHRRGQGTPLEGANPAARHEAVVDEGGGFCEGPGHHDGLAARTAPEYEKVEVRSMTDAPTAAASPEEGSLTFRRIVATVTDLAILSTSILVGTILINLVDALIQEAMSNDSVRSSPFSGFSILVGSLLWTVRLVLYIELIIGILYFSPGYRLMGLSVGSADGARLSMTRFLWRIVWKYLWLLLGILVILPLSMRRVSEGFALLISTSGPPIFFTAFVFWWVVGPGRSVYDLAAGTVVVRTHPLDEANFIKTWLILCIPVTLQVLVLAFLVGHFWGHPWDIPEDQVTAWEVRRNNRYAENLTNYSLAVLGLTALTYAIWGWRHRPSRGIPSEGAVSAVE